MKIPAPPRLAKPFPQILIVIVTLTGTMQLKGDAALRVVATPSSQRVKATPRRQSCPATVSFRLDSRHFPFPPRTFHLTCRHVQASRLV
jgi:hypothetical protein